MNTDYTHTPTPLGTDDRKSRGGLNAGAKFIIIAFILMTLATVVITALEDAGIASWSAPNGKQVTVHIADIEGNHISNHSVIPEEDIARVSDSDIYIQREALIADPSFIYIPEWRVKIKKPEIENFSYAFDGKDHLYIWGNVENGYKGSESVQGKIGSQNGQITPAGYIGVIVKSNLEASRNMLSVYDINETDYLYYIESPSVLQYYKGDINYLVNLNHTMQELREHFTDLSSYVKFE